MVIIGILLFLIYIVYVPTYMLIIIVVYIHNCYVLPIISLVKLFTETLICGSIDHRTFQRFRDTKSYAVKAQYRHAQCTIDIPTFLSPTSRKKAYAATAAVHLINACVVGISKGNKEKNPWFRIEKSVSLSQAAKYERSRNKQTRSQNLDCYLFFLIVNRLIVDWNCCFFTCFKLFVSKSSVWKCMYQVYVSYALIPTTSIFIIEIGDQSVRGVDCLIVTRIYDSRWRVISRSCLFTLLNITFRDLSVH